MMNLELFAFVIVVLNNLALTLVALIVNALFRSYENITDDKGSQFVMLYYSGHASWNEETETLLLFPSNGTTPVQVLLKQDAAKMKEYHNQKGKQSVFIMPDLDQFDLAICTLHAAHSI
jgi:thiosulfate reductase cytochrome b subunit